MKQTMEETVNQYVAAWNMLEASEIAAAFAQCMSANCNYTDKNTPTITGLQNIVALAMSSHKLYPGRIFSLISTPEYFYHQCRYYWHVDFVGQEGKDAMDFVEYDEDNKITRIVGFL